MIHRSTHRFSQAMVVLAASAVTVVVAPVHAVAQTPPPEVSAQDLASRALLLRMADFLARAPAISVTMRSDYDAIQADGQRIEFGERRRPPRAGIVEPGKHPVPAVGNLEQQHAVAFRRIGRLQYVQVGREMDAAVRAARRVGEIYDASVLRRGGVEREFAAVLEKRVVLHSERVARTGRLGHPVSWPRFRARY